MLRACLPVSTQEQEPWVWGCWGPLLPLARGRQRSARRWPSGRACTGGLGVPERQQGCGPTLDPQRVRSRGRLAAEHGGDACASCCPEGRSGDTASLTPRSRPGLLPGPSGTPDVLWLLQTSQPHVGRTRGQKAGLQGRCRGCGLPGQGDERWLWAGLGMGSARGLTPGCPACGPGIPASPAALSCGSRAGGG